MAIHTCLRGGLVEEHLLALDLFFQTVALGTPDIFVATCKGKLRPLVVIKSRRGPALHCVAVGAGSHAVLGGELRPMWVCVTGVTILGCVLKLDLMRPRQSLVAIAAAHNSVRPFQIEFRFGVIESLDINPRAHVVTSLTAQRCSICALGRHAIFKFTFVHVGMARRAVAVLKMKWQDFISAPGQADLVAFRAGNGSMGSGQWKARILVLGNRVSGPVEILNRVAIFAAVLVGSGVELVVMRVLMTIRASCKFNFVDRVFARWGMAFFTLYRRVFSFQRILRSAMFFHAE